MMVINFLCRRMFSNIWSVLSWPRSCYHWKAKRTSHKLRQEVHFSDSQISGWLSGKVIITGGDGMDFWDRIDLIDLSPAEDSSSLGECCLKKWGYARASYNTVICLEEVYWLCGEELIQMRICFNSWIIRYRLWNGYLRIIAWMPVARHYHWLQYFYQTDCISRRRKSI